MENGGKKITEIRLYKCGYCINNLSHILKKNKNKKVKFPALVALIEHEKYGNILYDTGYSKDIYSNGIVSYIYNLLNKTYVEEEDIIVNKLKKDNIFKINKVILSHAHPDHIGGLNLFENYELLATRETIQIMEKPKIKNLIFKNMLPNSNIQIKEICNTNNNHFLNKYFGKTYDILNDGSLIGIPLEGHSHGQLGIYVEDYKMLFAADSSWGEQFIDKIEQMKTIPKYIQNDFNEYKKTIQNLKQVKKDFPEIKIIFSHGDFEETRYAR